jgi:hypothetical protein
MLPIGDYLILGVIAATVLSLNGLASFAVLKYDLSERTQRIAQLLIVWLLPLLGALLVLAVHRKPQKPSGQYPDRTDYGPDATGIPQKGILDALDD